LRGHFPRVYFVYIGHILFQIAELALHRVRLAARRLPIGQYGAVVAGEHVVYNLLRRRIVQHLLGGFRLEHFVECELIFIQPERVFEHKLDRQLAVRLLLGLVQRPDATEIVNGAFFNGVFVCFYYNKLYIFNF
jgi:hypothetical protein